MADDRKRPSVAELEAVVAASRAGSMRGGARELGISPSALSHAISSIETRLQTRLFQRTTRSMSLTVAGASFVASARQALALVDAAVDGAGERSGRPTGLLRLVAPRGPALTALIPIILELRRRHPEVAVELVTATGQVDIVAEGYDAAVRYAGTVPSSMIALPCAPPSRIAIVGAPAYLREHPEPRSPRDLAAHECLRYRKDGATVGGWTLVTRGRQNNVEVHGHLVLDDEVFLLEAALAGAGLAYITHAMAEPHLRSGRLMRVLERYSPRFEPVQLYFPSRTFVRPALRALIDIVRAMLRQAA